MADQSAITKQKTGAADAAEAVWLSLHADIEAEAFEAAMDAAENGRGRLNIQIFNHKTGLWE